MIAPYFSATSHNPGTGPMSPYPGITDIESYATFGGDLGLNVQVGDRMLGLTGLVENGFKMK